MVNKIKKYIMVECSVEREKKISFHFIDYDLFKGIVYTHCDLYVHLYEKIDSNRVMISTQYVCDTIPFVSRKIFPYTTKEYTEVARC